MKIQIGCLKEHKPYEAEDNIAFDAASYKNDYVREISDVVCKATYQIDGDFLNIHVKVNGNAKLACAYTLEDVAYKIRCQDDLTFTDNKDNEDESTFYFDRNEVELDEYILGLIMASFPTKVIKKGAELPKDGKGYRVLSEEEFIKERANKKTSPFDALSDLDFDD